MSRRADWSVVAAGVAASRGWTTAQEVCDFADAICSEAHARDDAERAVREAAAATRAAREKAEWLAANPGKTEADWEVPW